MRVTSGHRDIALAEGYSNEFTYWMDTRCGHLMPKPCSDDHTVLANALYDLVTGKIPNNRLAVHGYRAMGKTRVVGPEFVPWVICETDINLIQIVSQSGGPTGLSSIIAKQIRDELADPVKQFDYGYKKGEQWAQEHFQVIRADGSTVDIYCRGKHSTIRGNRGMVIFEDIQDIDDVQSETILSRDEEWFFGDAINVPGPDDPVLWISNYLSPVSLAAKIETLGTFAVLKFMAEREPTGRFESSWPEQYPSAYLEMKYKELGRDRYGAEYLLNPRVSGNPIFLREWFRFYDPKSREFQEFLQQRRFTTVGYDGADSESNAADETAIVAGSCLAFMSDPNVYITKVWGGHTSLKKGIDRLFKVKNDINADEVIVESRVKAGNTGPQEEYIIGQEQILGDNLNYTIVKPERDKVTRAKFVQPFVERGRVFIDPNDPEHQKLLTQLILFTGEQLAHDDRVDAFVHMLTALMEWMKRQQPTQQRMQYDETTGRPIYA